MPACATSRTAFSTASLYWAISRLLCSPGRSGAPDQDHGRDPGSVRGKNFEEKVTVAAWKTRPSWYVLSEQDHMIQPALQEAMAKKISAHVVKLPTSHVPQLSRPRQVAGAIFAAAVHQSK